MNEDFDFMPPVFFRVFTLVAGIYFLVAIVLLLIQPITNIAYSFLENLVSNLNRLGLIFQFVGLISVLPDLLEKKNTKTWEKRLSMMGPKISDNRISLKYLIRTYSVDTVAQSDGVLGIINQTSRALAFLHLHIIVFALPLDAYMHINGIGIFFLCFLLIAYCWLGIELTHLKFAYHESENGISGIKTLRVVCYWICGGILYFIPLLMVALPLVALLKWISSHNLKTVIATIAFPFILLGTIFQLIGSFL